MVTIEHTLHNEMEHIESLEKQEESRMNPTTKISYVSTDLIRPASRTERSWREELTPWDLALLQTQYIQKGLFFHKPEMSSKLIKHLMESFSRTLDYFIPLTGCLASKTHEDNTISFYIDCTIVGAQFIHATAKMEVADLVDPLYVPDVVHSLFPLSGVMSYEGKSKPLLAVQVTELVDGIFIASSMNHAVADGNSFWRFMNSWSTMSRDLGHIPRIPLFQRWFLNDTDYPVRFPPSLQDQLGPKTSSPPSLSSSCVVYQRILHFTPQKIAQLKLKANSERETNQISSLQALLAHLWISITRARGLDPDEHTIMGMAAGNRARLNPPLPEDYFGNSFQFFIVMAKAGELLENGLGWVARQLNQAVKSHNDTTIRSHWESWIKKPSVFDPSTVNIKNILMISSSPRFDMFGNDFGWGNPFAVRCGQVNKGDGQIAVNPGAVKGSMDVEINLLPQTWKDIEKETHFTDV